MSSTTLVAELSKTLHAVNERIRLAYDEVCVEKRYKYPRLVAVSKTKPVEAILDAYSAGQRHFGENYVNELIEKSTDERILSQCPEIRWHFIGTLQSKTVAKFCSKVRNLYLVETVDSVQLAEGLQKRWMKNVLSNDSAFEKLNVFVQVNTSGEEQKSGVETSDAINLAKFIRSSCDRLNFMGFMTIGALEQSVTGGDLNRDFQALMDLRRRWCSTNNVAEAECELSMGMSADFETAIKMGSTNVRIGSTIFGSREYK